MLRTSVLARQLKSVATRQAIGANNLVNLTAQFKSTKNQVKHTQVAEPFAYPEQPLVAPSIRNELEKMPVEKKQ